MSGCHAQSPNLRRIGCGRASRSVRRVDGLTAVARPMVLVVQGLVRPARSRVADPVDPIQIVSAATGVGNTALLRLQS